MNVVKNTNDEKSGLNIRASIKPLCARENIRANVLQSVAC